MMFQQSKWFFEEFSKIFEENSEYLQEAIETYPHNTAFTDFIMERINQIIENGDCKAQNEYFRIDAMGYVTHYEDLEKIGGFNRHLWDLKIAVEHENDKADWLDEVIKLAHVCCPLRVVIGYVSIKNRRDDERLLAYVSHALQQLRCVDNVKRGEFLVILGNADTKTPADYFHYKAYGLNCQTLRFESLM